MARVRGPTQREQSIELEYVLIMKIDVHVHLQLKQRPSVRTENTKDGPPSERTAAAKDSKVISGHVREAEMRVMQCVFTGPPRVGRGC